MISLAIAKTIFSGKIGYVLWTLPFTVLAVTEAFLGQLIISLIVALIGATPPTIAIIMMAKKQSEERRIAQSALMERQDKMASDLDGKLNSLREAEKGQAKAEGIIEGGDKEQARVAATPTVPVNPEAVAKIEIVNPKTRPVPTVPCVDPENEPK